MQSITHLLCLLPTSGASSAACRTAVRLARRTGATLHLFPVGNTDPEAVRTELREAALPDGGGLPALRIGDAPSSPDAFPEAVRRYVHAADVDLLVTDTPPDRGPIPPLAAPRLQPLLRRPQCPVLVVGHERPLKDLRHVLVPTDLRTPAPPSFDYATALAAPRDGTIDLLHVLESDPYVALTPMDRLSLSASSLPERRVRRQLKAIYGNRATPNVRIETHVAHGDPADQIGRFVNHHTVDLMVLSSRRASSAPQSPLGSVADRVLRRVTCPILLVPTARASDPDGPTPHPQQGPV